jgi:CRP-like cAMP-binding protein
MSIDEYEVFKSELRAALEALRIRPPLPPSAIDNLVGDAQRLTESQGRTIFGPEDTHHFSYVLLRGRVRLECVDHGGTPRVIQVVRPGQLFGVEWLPTKRREVRAIGDTDVTAALITQDTINLVVAGLSRDQRLGLMSFVWRTLSALVVNKAGVRSLELKERVQHELRVEARAAGEPTKRGIRLTGRITATGLAARVGATPGAVRHALRALRKEGALEGRSGHLMLSPESRTTGVVPGGSGFQGIEAPEARPKLRELLERCDHQGLSRAAKDIAGQRAALFHIPAGALLLPPHAEESVAFIVRGSAWVEGLGPTGKVFTLQLRSTGRFVRLPTGASSPAPRLWGRAHCDSIVAVLTLEQMREMIGTMSDEGVIEMLDSTCKDLSRHLCDSTTAPTRAIPCRLFHAFLVLAHDFPGRDDVAVAVNVPLTLEDLARLVDAGHPAVAKALGRLMRDGWIERVAPQRYRLHLPPRESGSRWSCPICRTPGRTSRRYASIQVGNWRRLSRLRRTRAGSS